MRAPDFRVETVACSTPLRSLTAAGSRQDREEAGTLHLRRRLSVIAVLGTATCLLAAGCSSAGSSPTGSSGAPKDGGTLTIAGSGDVDFLDPTAGYGTITHTEERAWTRQLFAYPPSNNPNVVSMPVADMASVVPTAANGGITDNGLTYTIHLRPNVMWDSAPPRPVVAGDWVRSFKRLCNPVAPVGAPAYFTSTIVGMSAYCAAESKIPGTATAIASYINGHDISGVTAPNATTVVVHLLHPTADFLDIIAEPFASAVPVEYLKYVPNSPQFDAHVLADGPYKITSYKPGQQIVLERNPVWKASTDPIRKAYVNKIVITEGETAQSVQQQIQAGTVNLPWDVVVPTPDLPSLYSNPNLKINSSDAVMYAVFNEQSSNSNKAMQKTPVRQALEYVLDKAAIAQALGGAKVAQPVSQILGSIDVGYQPFNLYPTAGSKGDPKKTRQLLAAAGYPNGITLKLLYPTDSYNPQVAQLMQSDLQAAGVHVQMVPATLNDFINTISTPSDGARGTWDLALLFWVPDWFGINGRSVLEPMTDGSHYGPNSVDYGDYNSSVTDNLIQEALTQAPSATTQISDLWHQVSEQSMKDAAFIPLVQAGVPIFKSANVMNPVYLPINEAYDITNVWLNNA
jgi:peptide/nickel transport system substrate-binding protein